MKHMIMNDSGFIHKILKYWTMGAGTLYNFKNRTNKGKLNVHIE